MDSLFLACSVVIPMMIYMLTGGIIRKLGIFHQDQFRALNTMLFKVFIPFSLFISIYSVDLRAVVVPRLFLFTLLAVISSVLLTALVIRPLVQNGSDRATVIQGIYRSNFVLFGLTIAGPLCDAEGVAMVSALSAVVVPVFNVIAVILFELSRGGRIKPLQLVGKIFQNPLVDAGCIGIIFSLLRLQLPSVLESPVRAMAACATPMALVSLGGILSFNSVAAHKKLLVIAVVGKLAAVPVLFLGVAVLLGFRGDELVALLAVSASPTAVASAPMAQSMGGNGDLAGEIVVMTSVCCILTLFVFIIALSGLGWIG
ncbi:MAG: AEC family transporter [Lachnospiraceae bacterium]|nr:AEC family transporter [Lachnospiraceae bacterium]